LNRRELTPRTEEGAAEGGERRRRRDDGAGSQEEEGDGGAVAGAEGWVFKALKLFWQLD
jgi:hypothetical protein